MKPATNKLETHVFRQQIAAQKFLQEENVRIQSLGPFAEGRNNMFQHDVLQAIGVKHGKSVADVIQRWLTQRGVVVIPKSVRKDRIIENFNVFDFQLSDQDMVEIVKLDSGRSVFIDHRDPDVVKMRSTAPCNT